MLFGLAVDLRVQCGQRNVDRLCLQRVFRIVPAYTRTLINAAPSAPRDWSGLKSHLCHRREMRAAGQR